MNAFLHQAPSIDLLKDQARELRRQLEFECISIAHSKSLELLANQYGYKDWNTLHAVAKKKETLYPTTIGAKVRGRYLGQPFQGILLGVRRIHAMPVRFRLTLNFDQPVDVIKFQGLSNFRKRVSCTVDASGRTAERTSDGQPHMHVGAR